MLFHRKKDTALTKIPDWNLADLVPEFEELETAEKIRPVLDELCGNLHAIIEDFGTRVQAIMQAPSSKALADLWDDCAALDEHANRIETFISLYTDGHFGDPQTQALYQHSKEQFHSLQHAFGEIWQEFVLDPELVDRFIAEEPSLEEYRHALSASPVQEEYKSLDQQEAEAVAQDPRLANFSRLYRELNADKNRPLAERADIAITMFNAKFFQHSTLAKNQKTTPQSQYAINSGLPETAVEDFLHASDELVSSACTGILEPGKKSAPKEVIHSLKENSLSRKYSWAEAVDLVTTAFGNFHPELGALAHQAIVDGWVSAKPSDIKKSGAFSQGNRQVSADPANHPYVQMQFSGNVSDLNTLAHELGHAMADYLSGEAGNVQLNANALHETFALLGEGLLERELNARTQTGEEKQSLQSNRLASILGDLSLWRQIHKEHGFYQTFEQNGDHISMEEMRDISDREDALYTHQNITYDVQGTVASMGSLTHYINYPPFYQLSYPLARMGAEAILANFEKLDSTTREDYAQTWIEVMREGSALNYGQALECMDIAPQLENLMKPLAENIRLAKKELRQKPVALSRRELLSPKSFVERVKSSVQPHLERSR